MLAAFIEKRVKPFRGKIEAMIVLAQRLLQLLQVLIVAMRKYTITRACNKFFCCCVARAIGHGSIFTSFEIIVILEC